MWRERQRGNSCTGLVDALALTCSPCETIRRTLQRHHQRPILIRNSRWPAKDDDLITDFQRPAVHALSTQLRRAAPLDSPSLHFAVFIRHLDGHVGMWIAEYELHQLALELDRLAHVVCRAIGMVCI